MSRKPTNYRVSIMRGANMINAHPERMESADGTRWATGRYQKRSLCYGRYDAVQCWTLKTRDENGKVKVVGFQVGKEYAVKWIETGVL